jgi:2-methylaconitate cis-trans-isomerase PrpF
MGSREPLESEQIGVRCALVRGGSSKGVFFVENDLPSPGEARDRLLKRIMGTPDVMQIDGLGGTHLITSKIAVVGPATRDDADVDYTFGQAEITRDVIDWSGNCGNLSAGVGPFAIENGFVRPQSPVTPVRIHNTNTGTILVAHVPVANGRPRVTGSFAIAGVPGTGAEIFMDYSRTAGSKTGKLLPTGRVTDRIGLESGRSVEVTVCDVANPAVFVRASDLDLRGDETPDQFQATPGLVERMREIRGKVAAMIGFTSDWRRVDEESAFIPFLIPVAPPLDYLSLNRKPVAAADMDLSARQIFMNRCNESMAGTGSMCIAAAACIPGSVVERTLARARLAPDGLAIGHPGGVMRVRVVPREADNEAGVGFEALGFGRTARRIMDGTVYVPKTDIG